MTPFRGGKTDHFADRISSRDRMRGDCLLNPHKSFNILRHNDLSDVPKEV